LVDAERDAILAGLRVASVRTPYPTTSPSLRALTIVNDSTASVYKITVGWLDVPSERCPTAASAYRGRKDVHVALPPGTTKTAMSNFPADAKLFCIVDAALAPTRATEAAAPDAATRPESPSVEPPAPAPESGQAGPTPEDKP
jgi:hypothetical protein